MGPNDVVLAGVAEHDPLTDVLTTVLRELGKRSGHWHRALRRITGVDPVAPEDRGNIDKAAEAWLRWGKEQGYEW